MVIYKADFKKMRPREGFLAIYEKLGIDLKRVVNIRNVKASETTILAMRRVVERYVNRKYSHAVKRYRANIVGFDFLNWSPMTDNTIPDGEIHVYYPDD